MEKITVAHFTKTFGLKGEIRAYSMTDFPAERFQIGRHFFAVNSQTKEEKELTLKSVRPQGPLYVFSFEEVPSIEESELLQGWDLTMDKEEATLPEGMYRLSDLIGCKIVDEESHELGVVIDVLSNAPTKNLKIKKPDGKCFYCPFIDEFVPTVDLNEKKITIHVVEGLL